MNRGTASSKPTTKKKDNPFIIHVLSSEAINEPSNFKFGHGWVLKDVVTGFKGAVTYRCDNLTGCNQYGLAPIKGGGESKHIDETRLIWTGKIVVLPVDATEIKANPGGIRGLARKA